MSELPDEPPMARRVKPKPGFWLAAILTFAYWIVLIGFMVAVVVVVAIAIGIFGPKGALDAKPGGDAGDVKNLAPALRDAMAWSFPAGYLGGLLFSMVILRALVGKHWIHDIGLARLSKFHLLLGLAALPGFVIVSDALARLVQPLDTAIFGILGFGEVGDSSEALRVLFQDFHWSFAVFAVGVCPGVVEELWCRGLLGRGLVGRHGWFAGILLSSMFFGALHLWPPSYVIVTATMGAGLHFAYATSRCLWVPVAMHLVNNSFAVLASTRIISTEGMDAAMLARPLPIIATAAMVLLACGLTMWLARWTWPGEQPGILLPPVGSHHALNRAKANWGLAFLAFGFSAALIALLTA